MPVVERISRVDRTALVLAGLAAAIYLPGIWWGLPRPTSPQVLHGWDLDSVTGMSVLSEFHNLLVQPKPDWYVAYPLFHYLVLGVFYAPYLAYLVLSGGLVGLSAGYPFGMADPAQSIACLATIGRLVTTTMACGVVVATYLTGRTAWDRNTGILASLTVMLMSPMFYYARTGNLDVPVLFWTSLTVLIMAKVVAKGLTGRRGVWLGTLAALAVATKDQAYAVLVPALLLVLLIHYRGLSAAAVSPRRHWAGPAALLLSGGVAYSVASGLLLSPQRFALHLQYVLDFRKNFYSIVRPDGQVVYGFGGNLWRPSSPEGYALLAGDIWEAMVEVLGPVALGVALMGILLTMRPRPFSLLLIVMAAGQVVFAIVPVMHMQYRYAIPLGFVGAFVVARSLVLIWRRGGPMKSLGLVAAVAMFGWLGARGIDLTYQMLFDARVQAAGHLADSALPRAQIAYFGGVDQLPVLPDGLAPIRMPSDVTAIGIVAEKRPMYILVSPDAWSDAGMDRSWLLADSVYERLRDGSLGYQRVAVFETKSLLGRPVRFLPNVNPTVQLFSLLEPSTD